MVSWRAEEYASFLKKTSVGLKHYEDDLLGRFPPLGDLRDALNSAAPLKTIGCPAVFADADDNLLAWSCPGILSGRLQVRAI